MIPLQDSPCRFQPHLSVVRNETARVIAACRRFKDSVYHGSDRKTGCFWRQDVRRLMSVSPPAVACIIMDVRSVAGVPEEGEASSRRKPKGIDGAPSTCVTPARGGLSSAPSAHASGFHRTPVGFVHGRHTLVRALVLPSTTILPCGRNISRCRPLCHGVP